jgi:hypothetical protein
VGPFSIDKNKGFSVTYEFEGYVSTVYNKLILERTSMYHGCRYSQLAYIITAYAPNVIFAIFNEQSTILEIV